MKIKLNKIILIFSFFVFSSNVAYSQESIEVKFFADSKEINVEDRKGIVEFLKSHKPSDLYEFEIHSLSDPLNIGIDFQRLIKVQGVFREHDVEIEKLVNAKVRFISGNNQKLIIIRKSGK